MLMEMDADPALVEAKVYGGREALSQEAQQGIQ